MSNEGFMDPGESAAMLLESLATEGYASISPAEMLEDFVARTPALTPAERADILNTALGSSSAAEIDWGRTGSDIQSWGQFGAGLANLGASIAGMIGGQGGRDAQRILQGIGGVGGALTNVTGGMMQQFGRPTPGQVPPIRRPSPVAPTTPTRTPTPQPQRPGAPQYGGYPQAPQYGGHPQAPQYGGYPQAPQLGGRPGTDATAMLQQLFSNPQLMQALARGVVGGPTAPREVVLEIAGSEGAAEEVAIPLGAVMNAIATLATEAMSELNAQTHEDEAEIPSYLVGEEGELIVDPANAEDRASLVVDYFRRAREAERAGMLRGGEDDEGFEDFEDFESYEDDEDFESAEWDDFGR